MVAQYNLANLYYDGQRRLARQEAGRAWYRRAQGAELKAQFYLQMADGDGIDENKETGALSRRRP